MSFSLELCLKHVPWKNHLFNLYFDNLILGWLVGTMQCNAMQCEPNWPLALHNCMSWLASLCHYKSWPNWCKYFNTEYICCICYIWSNILQYLYKVYTDQPSFENFIQRTKSGGSFVQCKHAKQLIICTAYSCAGGTRSALCSALWSFSPRISPPKGPVQICQAAHDLTLHCLQLSCIILSCSSAICIIAVEKPLGL